jgi:hypothetical protein
LSLTLKPGTRLFGATSTTEVIVVRAPADPIELTIGGVPALLDAAERDGGSDLAEGHGGGAVMGKRYVDGSGTIELLCTKPGDGALAVGEELLATKDAKPLPASD